MDDFFANKHKIWLPQDPKIQNAFQVYSPSFQTQNLLSEEGRTIYGEACRCIFQTDNNQVERLQNLCTECLALNYKGGKIDPRLKFDNLVLFGEKLNIELPLETLIDVECDSFWKRVVQAKISNSIKFYELLKKDEINWKQEGIQLKFAEIIQENSPEDWNIDEFLELSKKLENDVKNLKIRYLKNLKKPENRYEEDEKNLDYAPVEVCHHGSLKFLKVLTNLETLSIQFQPKELFRSYKREAFECSYDDIENLAKGIKNLFQLKRLKITNSRLDSIKTDKIFTSFSPEIQLTHLDLSNCALNGDSAVSIGFFIAKSSVLSHIELRGNLLDEQGARCIAFGLQKTSSKNIYLGFSRNPIGNNGIIELGAGFCKGKNVSELDISGIDIDKEGIYRISHIVQLAPSIRKLNISGIEFTENAGNLLVAAIKDNFRIIFLECRACGLTEKQEFDLRCLVERNKFYSENPCMAKATFTKEDEQEIDTWFKRVKQPLLVEVQKQKNCPKLPSNPIKIDKIPEEMRRKIKKSTAELLGLSSLAETCTFDTFHSSRKFLTRAFIKSQATKDLEDMERSSLASKFRTLCSKDFNLPHYF